MKVFNLKKSLAIRFSFIAALSFTALCEGAEGPPRCILNPWSDHRYIPMQIDHACMRKEFQQIGETVLAKESVQQALKDAGVNPASIVFEYRERGSGDEIYVKNRWFGFFGSPNIICDSNMVHYLWRNRLSDSKAKRFLETAVAHELGHVVNNDLSTTSMACRLFRLLPNSQSQKIEKKADEFAIRHSELQNLLEAAEHYREQGQRNEYKYGSYCKPSPGTHGLASDRARRFKNGAYLKMFLEGAHLDIEKGEALLATKLATKKKN